MYRILKKHTKKTNRIHLLESAGQEAGKNVQVSKQHFGKERKGERPWPNVPETVNIASLGVGQDERRVVDRAMVRSRAGASS